MGSGIKTIILVLLNLLVVPEIENCSKDNVVFGFEELENNLHPSLQRRLFNYIVEYSKKYNSCFFITTHSSIVIDLFGGNLNAQIIHVESRGENSVAKSLLDRASGKNVLKDLDYRASDLLLSNGVIWVEGPSDAIYIELFLSLYRRYLGNEAENRLNYSVQALSTAIWKYAGYADFNWEAIDQGLENRIISLASINHNHLVIIDSDDNYENKKPSEWKSFSQGTGKNKARLIFETMKFSSFNEYELKNNYGDAQEDKLAFWITPGTFESYLEHFANHSGKEEFGKYFDVSKQRGYFEKKRTGDRSSISKVELASLIAQYVSTMNLSLSSFCTADSELFCKIERLHNTILSWN